MKTVGSRLMRRYMAAVHWFIPARLQHTPALLSRAQNIINAVVMAALAGPCFAALYDYLGYPAGARMIVLACVPMVATPFVMRWSGSMRAACEVFIGTGFCLFTWLSAHLGGVSAPTAPWLIVPPVVAMLIGGMRSAVGWTSAACLTLATLFALPLLGVRLPLQHVPDLAMLHLLSNVGLIVLVVVFVLLFEMTRTQGFIKLERALNFINELAIRDELTGVHNRRHLLALIDAERARSARAARPFCLCLLDIDFFKRINDTYGHSAGDEVLRAFAHAVQQQVRDTDSFGRYGGEEFLLMLPETPIEAAAALVERIRAAVEALRFADIDGALAMTVSIGVAQFRTGDTIAQSIARADEALYMAKARGRNRVVFHGQAARLASVPHSDVRHPPSSLAGVRPAIVDAAGPQRDQLTGLPNRTALRERLAGAVAQMPRAGRGGALMLLNVNKFREVNDALGFDAGDAVLVQIAHRVRACLHDADTIVRWGGDELAVVLENLAMESEALVVAEKILAQFGMPLLLEGREWFVSLSIGIAAFPGASDVDVLIKRADSALKTAKTWGDNKTQLYPSETVMPPNERFALKNQLRSALQNGELFLEYQPQIDLLSERMIGVEALVRWRHPLLGRIEPSRFISLAEETGLIVPIGEWVMRTACLQNRAWVDAGLPPLTTAVNVSARQLRHPQLVERILHIIADTGIAAGCLDLEITEGILIDDFAALQPGLAMLRRAGVKISIDDFGTGYSSLGYLAELPADILKMDRSFVNRLGESADAAGRERSYALARSIVQLAHGLNLKVVAEAVETAAQCADLMAMDCDVAQGYLFDRPLHPDQVGQLLRAQADGATHAAAPAIEQALQVA
ncbi:putative bifunctional diguanylate cyclase/phosphodiesterase [Massilia sp. DWR3-1-1]|uniref:putative bifunctional diguanylate cyclase/phosphodiesterase n=1 Tax=Massilia sp. DWR3-1-1 TaxID=2804559 RepID=UPI003CE7E593